jgi:hypothetical protein
MKHDIEELCRLISFAVTNSAPPPNWPAHGCEQDSNRMRPALPRPECLQELVELMNDPPLAPETSAWN